MNVRGHIKTCQTSGGRLSAIRAVAAFVLSVVWFGGVAKADVYNLYYSNGGISTPPGDGTLYTGMNSTGTSYASTPGNQVTLTTTVYSTDVTAIYSRTDGLINYTQGGPGSIGDGSSGSGTYTRMFAAEQTGSAYVEKAYNGNMADDSNNPPSLQDADWDQKQGVGEPKVLVLDVSTVVYNGTRYFELLLDGQENENAVTIDELLVFTAPSRVDIDDTWVDNHPDPTLAEVIQQFELQGATLRYSLDDLNSDNTIATNNTILTYVATGSGAGDVGFYLPVNAVTEVFNGGFLGNGSSAAYTDRFYVWVQHGLEMGDLYPAGATKPNQAINFGAGATYEEWAYRKNGVTIEDLLPEPSTTLGGMLISGMLFFPRYRTRRPAC